jgi:hypothetical protein
MAEKKLPLIEKDAVLGIFGDQLVPSLHKEKRLLQ